MRNGYILLHRQGLTQEEWKHPLRTLAWIDFLTMAAYEEFTAEDGVVIHRGEVIASYGFLATRWAVSKDTAYQWIKHWIAERQVERRTERCTERSAERFFVVNYAKYQDIDERVAERPTERAAERTAEQMKRIQVKENSENENNTIPRFEKSTVKLKDKITTAIGISDFVEDDEDQLRYLLKLDRLLRQHSPEDVNAAWQKFSSYYGFENFRYIKSIVNHFKTLLPKKPTSSQPS